MKDPMSLRLGDLSEPLLKRCGKTGETPSEVCRIALAKELGVELPEVRQGFAAMGAARAKKAQRKSVKTRRARSEG